MDMNVSVFFTIFQASENICFFLGLWSPQLRISFTETDKIGFTLFCRGSHRSPRPSLKPLQTISKQPTQDFNHYSEHFSLQNREKSDAKHFSSLSSNLEDIYDTPFSHHLAVVMQLRNPGPILFLAGDQPLRALTVS
jgi:hypothetical protein